MNEWGLNPATFQAAGAIATTVALVFIILSFRNNAHESNLRTRPWLVLRALTFTGDDLQLVFSNIGELPAFKPAATVLFSSSGTRSVKELLEDLDSREAVRTEETAVIFPQREAQVSINNFGAIIRENRPAGSLNRMYGRVWYEFGNKTYHTSFAFNARIGSDEIVVVDMIEVAAI